MVWKELVAPNRELLGAYVAAPRWPVAAAEKRACVCVCVYPPVCDPTAAWFFIYMARTLSLPINSPQSRTAP